MSLLDRLTPRRTEPAPPPMPGRRADSEAVFPTLALPKFLAALTARELPVLLDLGPVVGSNVTFFGEELGCKIFVHDVFSDLERHARAGEEGALPAFIAGRFSQPDGIVDGVLCWDVLDYLDRPSGEELARQVSRVLRPGGSVLGLFGTAPAETTAHTKFLIEDQDHLRYRTAPARCGRRSVLVNRDIIKLFPGLDVSDSFLLKNQIREFLFRKPA